MVGHHHDFFGRGEPVDADRVELALGAAHDAVMHHDEIGIGLDHLAGVYRGSAAGARDDFFNCS